MLEKEVAKSLDQVRDLIDQAITRLGDIGPEVMRATGTAIFMRGLANLIGSLIVCVLFCYAGRRLLLWANVTDDEVDATFGHIFGWGITAIGIFTLLFTWMMPGNWLAVFNQKAWIANEVLNQLLR